MITNSAITSAFLALAIASNGSVAMGQKTVHLAKTASSADPFDESGSPAKPAAGPTAAAPPRPAAPPAKPAATTAAPPAPPRPSKELEAFMKGFEGNWKCDTTFAAGSLWPGSQPLNAKTDITIKKDFGGFSWHGEFRLAKTATTAATSGVFQIGYAASTRQATFLSYDSLGSAMMGAGALSGDSVTFAEEGFLKGAKVKVRETLAAKGPRKLYHKVEIEHGSGYQAMAEDTCSK